MRRRVFIDCDDTLALYQNPGPNPYGFYMLTPFEVNARLIKRIRDWARDHPEDTLFIWSGGGREYAEMWMRKLGLDDIMVPLAKDPALIRPGDIVVDDEWARRTHTPFEEWA